MLLVLLSLTHRASGKSVKYMKTNYKKQVPGTFYGFYPMQGIPMSKRQLGDWWGRRDITKEDLMSYDKENEDKKQKVPGWWGRRDAIYGDA